MCSSNLNAFFSLKPFLTAEFCLLSSQCIRTSVQLRKDPEGLRLEVLKPSMISSAVFVLSPFPFTFMKVSLSELGRACGVLSRFSYSTTFNRCPVSPLSPTYTHTLFAPSGGEFKKNKLKRVLGPCSALLPP